MIESHSPDLQRVLEVLRASGVFGGLPDAVLRDLAALLKVQFVPGGDLVYREGDQAHSMFFVVSGRLRVSRRDRAGALQLYNEILSRSRPSVDSSTTARPSRSRSRNGKPWPWWERLSTWINSAI